MAEFTSTIQRLVSAYLQLMVHKGLDLGWGGGMAALQPIVVTMPFDMGGGMAAWMPSVATMPFDPTILRLWPWLCLGSAEAPKVMGMVQLVRIILRSFI